LVNTVITSAINSDGSFGTMPNGYLDLSVLVVFRPLNQTAGQGGSLELNFADCQAPSPPPLCIGGGAQSANYTNITGSPCLGILPGTTAAETTANVKTPSGNCFLTDNLTLTLELAGISIPLVGVRGAATYTGGTPATGLSMNSAGDGLLRGFLDQDTAATILLPPEFNTFFPGLGGQPLSTILRGGAGNCARKCLPPAPTPTPTGTPTLCQENAECSGGTSCVGNDDRDKACAANQTNAGTQCTDDSQCIPGGPGTCKSGWYFYLNFSAFEVPFVDPTPTPGP
jgi:hypothetical protein